MELNRYSPVVVLYSVQSILEFGSLLSSEEIVDRLMLRGISLSVKELDALLKTKPARYFGIKNVRHGYTLVHTEAKP